MRRIVPARCSPAAVVDCSDIKDCLAFRQLHSSARGAKSSRSTLLQLQRQAISSKASPPARSTSGNWRCARIWKVALPGRANSPRGRIASVWQPQLQSAINTTVSRGYRVPLAYRLTDIKHNRARSYLVAYGSWSTALARMLRVYIRDGASCFLVHYRPEAVEFSSYTYRTLQIWLLL
jgi:hypothetical protein